MSYKLYSTLREAKAEESYDSSCVLVRMPKEISKILDSYNYENIPDDCIAEGKKRETEYHVTILYGIEDTSSEETLELLKKKINSSTFKVRLGAVSKFYQDDYDVVKIDIDDYTGKLEAAFDAVNENIDNRNEYDSYHPHCTLAYVRKGTCEHLIGDSSFEGVSVVLNELEFSSSDEDSTVLTTFGKKKVNWNVIKEEIRNKAQGVLDDWNIEDEDNDIEGGACDIINEEIQTVLVHYGFTVADGGQEGDDHVYSFATDGKDYYRIDIPYYIYETGAGYSWEKLPNVKLTTDDIVVEQVDRTDVGDLFTISKKKKDRQTLETQRRLKEIGDEEEQQSWIEQFHADSKNYQSDTFYRVSNPYPESRGNGVGKGLYLSKDRRAVENFYNIEGDGELETFKGTPKILDLTDYEDFENFEEEAKEKYSTEENEHFKKLTLEKGYDGIRYYDPVATGDEYVFYNTERLKKVGKKTLSHAGEVFYFLGERFDVDLAEQLIKASPRETVLCSIDGWYSFSGLVGNDPPFKEVDLSVPLIIVPMKGSYLPIDGWHRIRKAHDDGVKELEAYVLTEDETRIVQGQQPKKKKKKSSLSGGFDSSQTDMPHYDAMLNNPEYYKKEKGFTFTIEYMAPQEYLERCAEMIYHSVEPFIAAADKTTVEEYADDLRAGAIFPMVVIDYSRLSGQEGRHRALAAQLAGIQSIPVMIIKDAKK